MRLPKVHVRLSEWFSQLSGTAEGLARPTKTIREQFEGRCCKKQTETDVRLVFWEGTYDAIVTQ